jgi:HEAT repeat protein
VEQQEPFKIIERLFKERALKPDRELLNELEELSPLPDEGAEEWSDPTAWERAYLFLALADAAAARKLRAAAPLLMERACYGDPGEMMRGLRHTLEAIFAPDWSALTRVCEESARSTAKGARLWAVAELGVLLERSSAPVLLARLSDEESEIRAAASRSLGRLCSAHPEVAEEVRAQVRSASAQRPQDAALGRLAAELGAG